MHLFTVTVFPKVTDQRARAQFVCGKKEEEGGYVCCFSDVRSHLGRPLTRFLTSSLPVARETHLGAAAAGSILSLSAASLRDDRDELLGISGGP